MRFDQHLATEGGFVDTGTRSPSPARFSHQVGETTRGDQVTLDEDLPREASTNKPGSRRDMPTIPARAGHEKVQAQACRCEQQHAPDPDGGRQRIRTQQPPSTSTPILVQEQVHQPR